ncbi:uncharacterized protein LOC125903844 [Epinephelus fuscoguttatus]|uniref:uncharacterized protein LOC125903844 n=1 Tax=Epinephelus fuscoguttatus TaxID=293821 RepID=UPI0020D0F063|nr:uncharacterized protein LOC125903844 [Epinephelus fuscoguttatus]
MDTKQFSVLCYKTFALLNKTVYSSSLLASQFKLMAMPPKYLLRVYIATDVAVKVTLNERPTSVDELIGILKDKVKPRLDFEFTLQYEDPDGGELCCLVDVEDLPEKGTLRVVRSERNCSGDPLVKDFLERWPALQVQSQVCAEFHRITNVNLRNQFYSELDRHIPQLIELYRQKAARTGRVAGALRDILQYYESEDVHDINMKRTVALRALSVYLREEDTQFFKTWNTEESEEPDIGDTPIAIVTMVRERSASPVHFSPVSTAIVVEDEFIIRDIATFADAYVLLFGLVYVLHLDYPKKLLGTFTFIQKVVMGLDDGAPLKPALLALKNDLLTK